VAASGNVDHDQFAELLARSGWGDVPAGDPTPLATLAPVPAPPANRHVHSDNAQTHIVFGSATVPHGDPRRMTLGLVSMLLGGGMSSRLFQRVREELGLAYSVYTYQSFHVDAGMHGVYVATAPETAKQAAEAVRAELQLVAESGLPDDELEAGKRQMKGQITLSLEGVSSRMYRAAGVELYGEPYRPLDEVLALVDAIQPDDVRAVCRDFFAPDTQSVLSLGPKPAL
jgi:predicted Zn-dependent peptidase